MSFAVVVVVVVGVDVFAGLLQVLMVLMATIFELGCIWIKSKKILHYVCRLLLLLSSSWLSCNALSLLACLLHMYVSHHTPQCCQFDHTHDMKKMNLTLNYKPLFVVCGIGW
jgi:hypothetical protein